MNPPIHLHLNTQRWLRDSAKTTYLYVEADLAMNEQALARLQEPGTSPARYSALDSLLQFLKSL